MDLRYANSHHVISNLLLAGSISTQHAQFGGLKRIFVLKLSHLPHKSSAFFTDRGAASIDQSQFVEVIRQFLRGIGTAESHAKLGFIGFSGTVWTPQSRRFRQ